MMYYSFQNYCWLPLFMEIFSSYIRNGWGPQVFILRLEYSECSGGRCRKECFVLLGIWLTALPPKPVSPTDMIIHV